MESKTPQKTERKVCKDGSLDMRFAENKGLEKHGPCAGCAERARTCAEQAATIAELKSKLRNDKIKFIHKLNQYKSALAAKS